MSPAGTQHELIHGQIRLGCERSGQSFPDVLLKEPRRV